MLEYMLDTNICIYVIKNRPAGLRERFDQLAEALCISTITLGELLYGVEKSARRSQNLEAEAITEEKLHTLVERLVRRTCSKSYAKRYRETLSKDCVGVRSRIGAKAGAASSALAMSAALAVWGGANSA
jgi:predicted nucleic acid-binding protein